MTIDVDHAKCQGIGLCEAAAPRVFEVRDGKAHLLLTDPVGPDRAAAEHAVSNCPARALSIDG